MLGYWPFPLQRYQRPISEKKSSNSFGGWGGGGRGEERGGSLTQQIVTIVFSLFNSKMTVAL